MKMATGNKHAKRQNVPTRMIYISANLAPLSSRDSIRKLTQQKAMRRAMNSPHGSVPKIQPSRRMQTKGVPVGHHHLERRRGNIGCVKLVKF